MKTLKMTTVALACGFALAGCNSDSTPDDSTATFSFAVSDAAVDSAAQVMVCFSGVELVGNGLPPQEFTVGGEGGAVPPNDLCLDDTGNPIPDTVGVDLLSLQGANAEALVSGAEVPAGDYGQMRLEFSEAGSFIELDDGTTRPLGVPSGKLRLDGVTLTANQTFNYTLEFDLRRAVIAPPGLDNYVLKPRGLRLVNNASVGHIEGEVAESLLMNSECTVAPEDTSVPVAAVYMYQGHDLSLDELTDNNEDESSYASISVFFDGAAAYPFEIGYIEEGDYSIALTCDTNDDPEAVDDLTFEYVENITIEANSTLELSLGE
ncbi:DUF4382 domain-containing protein [Aliidiomarina sp. Khilg15.8]